MGSVSREELRRQEAAVIAACADQLARRPLAEVTVQAVAQAAGLSVFSAHRAVRRIVGHSRRHFIRRGVLQLTSMIADQAAAGPAPRASVLETIEASVAHMAEIAQSFAFRGLFRLVVCEGAFRPWLHELYEGRVAAAFCQQLERSVGAAGRQAGLEIFFDPGVPREVLRRLEAAFALPLLLPGGKLDAAEGAASIRKIAEYAFARSHAWEVDAAA